MLVNNVYNTINIYGYGIQHTCIFYLYSYKNRVLACFQTRPSDKIVIKQLLCTLLYIYTSGTVYRSYRAQYQQ